MVEVKINKKTSNPLMDRDEVECVVNFEQGTPKVAEIKAAVAKALAASDSMLVINRLVPRFGAKQAKVFVSVYASQEAMKKSVKAKKQKVEKKPAA
ncbi:30S ribosomal protein S24e [uncultured archaeon]|nr:30S ribosomal protein S24e [uncultured archaeon]